MSSELFSEENIISQPSTIKLSLYVHQLMNIRKMINLESSEFTKVGFLSDMTGYGKTLTMLGFISANTTKNENGRLKKITLNHGNDWIKNIEEKYYEETTTNLLITTNVLIKQWEKELEYTGLKYYVIMKQKDMENIQTELYDIILLNVNLFSVFYIKFGEYFWERIIIDEPQIIKNIPFDKVLNTNFLWFVTATPYDTILKYKKIFNTGLEEKIIVKNSKEFLSESIVMPTIEYTSHNINEPIMNICKNLLSAHQYEVLMSGNYELLFQMLGYKKMDMKNVVEVLMKKFQNFKNIDERQRKINELQKKLSEVCEYECPICTENLNGEIVITSCCHNFFCKKCLLPILLEKGMCPLCRGSLEIFNFETIQSHPSKKICVKTKYQILDEIFQKVSNKIILYSENSDIINYIKTITEIPVYTLSGKTEEKIRSLESYKSNEKAILFLDSILYTSGINLECTTDIIISHYVSESIELQIIGRAYRLGRKNGLNIHKML